MTVKQADSELVRDGLARVKEACAFLGLSVAMLYKLMDAGSLPFVKIGRARRIPHNALVELAARGLVTGKEC